MQSSSYKHIVSSNRSFLIRCHELQCINNASDISHLKQVINDLVLPKEGELLLEYNNSTHLPLAHDGASQYNVDDKLLLFTVLQKIVQCKDCCQVFNYEFIDNNFMISIIVSFVFYFHSEIANFIK